MGDDKEGGITRRAALAAGLAGAAMAALPALNPKPPKRGDDDPKAAPRTRLPVVFLPHGGGPWPFVDLGLRSNEVEELSSYLRSLSSLPKAPPKSLLVVSAHWEESVPTVTSSERPPLFYDYYGFPPESYQVTWPAPGDPVLAERVQRLLGAEGFTTANNPRRGFDHGTFVPLKLTYPEAGIKTVQLSLKRGLDPAEHIAIGRALAPLREEGVFIVASGMSYHNMRGFRDPRAVRTSEVFDEWLRETATLEPARRNRRLVDWTLAPAARLAHPREEHLLPLMVAAGAAGDDLGNTSFSGTMMGMRISAYHFG